MVVNTGLRIKGKDFKGNIREGKIIKILKGFRQVIIQCSNNKSDTYHITFDDIIEIC